MAVRARTSRERANRTKELHQRMHSLLRSVREAKSEVASSDVERFVSDFIVQLEESEKQLENSDEQRRLAYEQISELRSELTAREQQLNDRFNEVRRIRANLEEQNAEELERSKKRENELSIMQRHVEEKMRQIKQRELDFEADKLRHEEQSKQALQASSRDFIRDTIKDLTKDEAFYSWSAFGWALLGGSAIIAAFGAFSFIAVNTVEDISVDISWQALTLYSAKGAVLLSISALIARYAFLMSQKNLDVSRKKSDRIHGIKFGQLYIESYGATAGWDQLKDAFSAWNSNETSEVADRHSKHPDLDLGKLDSTLESVLNSVEKVRSTIKTG